MPGEDENTVERVELGDGPHRRSHPVSLGGAALIVWVARRLERQQRREDPDAPGMVRSDEKSQAVSRRAMQLAREGREDAAAVSELRELAQGRRRTLKRAEHVSRLGARHLEEAEANRAHRLLVAACDRTDITPPPPADRARFEVLDEFYAASRLDQDTWEALLAREPRLGRLLGEVREGRFGPIDQFNAGDATKRFRNPELQRRQGESARGALALMDEVKTLLGPSRSSVDPVLTARRTRAFVDRYLLSERPA